jgi:hypothetical protein
LAVRTFRKTSGNAARSAACHERTAFISARTCELLYSSAALTASETVLALPVNAGLANEDRIALARPLALQHFAINTDSLTTPAAFGTRSRACGAAMTVSARHSPRLLHDPPDCR